MQLYQWLSAPMHIDLILTRDVKLMHANGCVYHSHVLVFHTLKMHPWVCTIGRCWCSTHVKLVLRAMYLCLVTVNILQANLYTYSGYIRVQLNFLGAELSTQEDFLPFTRTFSY
jgi:hypothetical protein